MKIIQNSLNQYILYSFSNIKVRNQGQQQKNINIQINHKIVDSKEVNELLKLHEQQHEIFNFINYSTFYKKITQLPYDKLDQNSIVKLNKGLHQKLISSNEWKGGESISRAVAQLGFYFTKLLEQQKINQTSSQLKDTIEQKNSQISSYEMEIEAIHKILDEEGIKLFNTMNDQEKANFLYQLCKRGQIQQIKKISKEIEMTIQPKMQFKALLSIMYSLTISGIEWNQILLQIDKTLITFLSKYEAINYLSCRDLSDIMFFYSKNQHVLGDSKIFSLIETAIALPYTPSNPSNEGKQIASNKINTQNNRYNKNQSEGSWLNKENISNQRKIASLFRNEYEVDTLSISSMFNSIANFSENKFSYDFYERFENIIILLRFKNPRQLANAFRGIALYYTPSDPLFVQIENQAQMFFKKNQFENDLQSFSTILYFTALHSKGSLSFYQKAEEFAISHLQNFNMRQLNFIFFSFKFSNHYHLQRQNKEIIIKHILQILPILPPEEMSSIVSNFSEFEDDTAKRQLFFDSVAYCIENQNHEIEIDDKISYFCSIFKSLKQQNPSQDITLNLPKFTQKFIKSLETQNSQNNINNQQQKSKNIQLIQINELIEIFQDNQEIIGKLKSLNH